MRQILTWFGVFCMISTQIYGQEAGKTDSLLNQLSRAHTDSGKFELLKRIAFSHPDPVQSLVFANEALELSQKLGDPVTIARALEEVSLSHRLLGNKIESFQAAFDALRIYDSLDMHMHQATQYVQIGGNYAIEGDFQLAITYLIKGRKMYLQLGSAYELALTDINIGETFRLMGSLDSALLYTTQALRYGQDQNYAQIKGYALGNLGMIYSQSGQFDDAKENLIASLEIMYKLEDPYSTSIYQSELATVYGQQGDSQRSLMLLQKAYQLAMDNGLKEQVRDIGKQLAAFYESNKIFDQALYYTRIFEAYEDSLINRENIKGIEQLKAQYEYEKRDKEIAEKQAEIERGQYVTKVTFIIAGLMAVIVVISLLAFIRKRKDHKLLTRQKNEIADREAQKQWLLGELQHRTKNNLQMISSLLSLQSRQLVGHPSYDAIQEGKSRVDALAIIHQRLYHEGSQLKINIRDYIIELVESLAYSFDIKVDIQFEISSFELDVDKAIPLALVVNELVTNSLKHAYGGVNEPQLVVRFGLVNQALQLEVADNGPGIVDSISNNQSFGLRLVRSLVAQIKATLHKRDTLVGCHWEVKLSNYALD